VRNLERHVCGYIRVGEEVDVEERSPKISNFGEAMSVRKNRDVTRTGTRLKKEGMIETFPLIYSKELSTS
jgi:hypothetical protein